MLSSRIRTGARFGLWCFFGLAFSAEGLAFGFRFGFGWGFAFEALSSCFSIVPCRRGEVGCVGRVESGCGCVWWQASYRLLSDSRERKSDVFGVGSESERERERLERRELCRMMRTSARLLLWRRWSDAVGARFTSSSWRRETGERLRLRLWMKFEERRLR